MIRTYRQYWQAIESGDLTPPSLRLIEQMTTESVSDLISKTWDLSLDLLSREQLPEARHVLRLLAIFADAPIPYELLLSPELLATFPALTQLTGPRLWKVLNGLAGVGLIILSTQANWLH